MRTLIVFYSRTGTTKKLALALADALNAELREIECKRYRPGILRYLRAGYDSVRGNLPPIEFQFDLKPVYDLVLVGTPIWTSHPALPVRTFLTQHTVPEAPVGLFLTHGGHSPPQDAIKEMETLLARPAEATLVMNENDMSDSRVAGCVRTFVEKLTIEPVG